MPTTPEPSRTDRRAEGAVVRFVKQCPVPALAVTAEDRVVALSVAFTLGFGHSIGTLRGRRVSTLVHPDDAVEVNRCLVQARGSAAPVSVVHRFRTLDGEYRQVASVLAASTGGGDVTIVSRDVTVEHRLVDSLSDRLDAWEQVFDLLREGVVVIDPAGLVVAVNGAAAAFLAVDPAELGGSLARAQVVVVDENGHPMRSEHLPSTRAFATGSTQEEPLAYRRRDGSVVWLYARAIPLRRPGEQRPSRVAIVLEDAVTSPVAAPVRLGRPPDRLLTPREREVLNALADGLDVRAIAARLGISLHTARGHVKSVLQKLDARTQLQAVVIGVRAGLVDVR